MIWFYCKICTKTYLHYFRSRFVQFFPSFLTSNSFHLFYALICSSSLALALYGCHHPILLELYILCLQNKKKKKFLFDEVQNFAVGNNCSQLVIDALNWKFIPSRRDQINTKFQTQPRKFKMGLLAMAGTGGGSGGVVGAGNANGAGSTNKGGNDGGCGGSGGDGSCDMTVERYSVATNEWIKVQYDDMKFPEGCAVVELNGEIIVLGGCQHKNRSISDVSFNLLYCIVSVYCAHSIQLHITYIQYIMPSSS